MFGFFAFDCLDVVVADTVYFFKHINSNEFICDIFVVYLIKCINLD